MQNLADMLWGGTSPHAICRGNFNQLQTTCFIAVDTASEAFALRTAKQDVSHWEVWAKYCSQMNTDPMRPTIDAQLKRTGYLREVVLLVNALVHFMKTRRPRSNWNKCIKPQSALNILLGANRVLKQNYMSFIPLNALKLPLKGLMRKFILQHWPVSLIPKRREPLTNGMIRALASLPEGVHLGPLGKHKADSLVDKPWRAAVSVASSSGFRKAEMFQSDAETFYLTWNLIDWIISGVGDADPTD